MKLFSNRGYSLVEIGVAIIVITVFAAINLALYTSTYSNYRVVDQRNIALTYAITNMEKALQRDIIEYNIDYLDADEIDNLISSGTLTVSDLLSVEFNTVYTEEIPASEENHNMKITTSISRIPVYASGNNYYGYDESLLKVTVSVEYKLKSNDTETKSIVLESLRVNEEFL